MMRTLVTGAAGYIGLHIVRELLADGQVVTALVRSPAKLGPFLRDPRLTVVETDLEDTSRVAEALPGHDVCIHAALIWGEPGSELELHDTAATAKLFDAAGRAGVARCIYLSSAAVHRPFVGEMSEADCISTTDLYGATKAAGELFLRAACAQHQTSGVVMRLGPVVGPPAFVGGSFRSDHRIADMVAAAIAGRVIEVAQDEGRQFSDASLVARASGILARLDNPQPTYLCVDRDLIIWERIARLVVDTLSSSSEVRVFARSAQEPVARFCTDRYEGLLGGSTGAEEAMSAHIRQLAQLQI